MRSIKAATKRGLAAVGLAALTFALVGLSLGRVGPAQAQEEVHKVVKVSVIGNEVTEAGTNTLGNNVNGSFQDSHGVTTMNQASGTLNSQANLLSVATSSSGGQQLNSNAVATEVRDNTLNLTDGASSHYRAVIGGRSFQGSTGVVMANQVSGNMNIQVTQVGLNLGNSTVAPLTSQQLSAVNSHNSVNLPAKAHMTGTVKLDEGAFQNFHGVAVVSQVAGNMNQVMTAVNVNVR